MTRFAQRNGCRFSILGAVLALSCSPWVLADPVSDEERLSSSVNWDLPLDAFPESKEWTVSPLLQHHHHHYYHHYLSVLCSL